MLPSYRLLKFGLALLAAAGLFALTTVSPLAQSSQAISTPEATPTTHISDPAGIIDPKMRNAARRPARKPERQNPNPALRRGG